MDIWHSAKGCPPSGLRPVPAFSLALNQTGVPLIRDRAEQELASPLVPSVARIRLVIVDPECVLRRATAWRPSYNWWKWEIDALQYLHILFYSCWGPKHNDDCTGQREYCTKEYLCNPERSASKF